jgi:hypothetical protein
MISKKKFFVLNVLRARVRPCVAHFNVLFCLSVCVAAAAFLSAITR